MKQSSLNKLKLTYEQYKKHGKTIANSTIGKYLVYNQIGRGAFGAVYKGMNDDDKKMVAIKVLDLQAVEKEPSERIRQIRRRLCATQSQIMRMCNSDNVVKCYDVYENKSLKIMIIQFCNGGTLQDEIDKKIRIPEKQAILILKQIINGIAELHSHKIVHRDLKAENILSHNGVYKIADMGFSKQQVQEEQINQTTLGTITTMAPQVMKKQPYGLKADIWSIGVIFFQMVFGQVPYRSTTANQMYDQIKNKKILNTDRFSFNNYTASEQVTRFLKDMLVIDSNKRMGWKQLVKHPLFNQNGQGLANQFRISIDLKVPTYEQENNFLKEDEDLFIRFQQQEIYDKKPQEVIRLTQAQAKQKMDGVQVNEDIVFEWVKNTHLQCLKTQLIYNQIILNIQQHNLLNLEKRQVVQFMYLLITRCKNNISVINDKLKKQGKENEFVVKNLMQTVKSIYQTIQAVWKHYSSQLTKIENQVGSIIGDKFSKLFNRKSFDQKDKFLVGVEGPYYSKMQQIEFTDKFYISQLKDDLQNQNSPVTRKVKNYLLHYVEINKIKISDLLKRGFDEYVETIIQ